MKSVDSARLAPLLSARASLPANAPAKPAPWAAAPVRFDFGGGKPDPISLPYAEIADATRRLLEGTDGPAALTYGALAGADALRDVVVAKHARREGLAVSRDEVFITNGSSQALAIVADALLDPGDTVVVEAPSFSGSLAIFRKRGAEIVGVPLDDAGLRTDALEETLRALAARGKRAKIVYTIDYFQNPTGVTPRRRAATRPAANRRRARRARPRGRGVWRPPLRRRERPVALRARRRGDRRPDGHVLEDPRRRPSPRLDPRRARTGAAVAAVQAGLGHEPVRLPRRRRVPAGEDGRAHRPADRRLPRQARRDARRPRAQVSARPRPGLAPRAASSSGFGSPTAPTRTGCATSPSSARSATSAARPSSRTVRRAARATSSSASRSASPTFRRSSRARRGSARRSVSRASDR